jgi:hypothetical protein
LLLVNPFLHRPPYMGNFKKYVLFFIKKILTTARISALK